MKYSTPLRVLQTRANASENAGTTRRSTVRVPIDFSFTSRKCGRGCTGSKAETLS